MVSLRFGAALSVLAGVAAGVEVEVYEGPKTCDDSEKVVAGKYLSMHYTGTIDKSSSAGTPGSQFDSSRDRSATFDFQIGEGQVISGWDTGLQGLCKGAKATLVIPPEEGYGEDGAGDDIPGGATLHFDVEVVDVNDSSPPEENLFEKLDVNQDKKLDKEEVLAYLKEQDSSTTELPEGMFEEDDKDGDGFISWQEFSGPKGETHEEENLFEKLDVNQDKKLDKEEVLAYFKEQDPSATELPEGMFEEEDADSDGFISWQEFSGPKGETHEEEL